MLVLLGVVIIVACLHPFGLGKRGRQPRSIPGWTSKPAHNRLGDLGVVFSSGSLHNFLLQRHREGRCPVSSFWWRDQRIVSVCSPQAFKDTEHLYNRPKLIFESSFEVIHGARSIQSLNNGEWKERKKLLYSTLRGRNLEDFFDDFVQVAQETEGMWCPGRKIELMKETFRMTIKSIVFTSLENIFQDNSGIEELANLYHLCKIETDSRLLNLSDSSSDREQDFQQNFKCLMDLLKQMICARKERKDGKKIPLLDALLGSGNSEEEILSDMVTFLGGFHTSAYYTTWTFYYLAQHPDVQEKLIREIKKSVGGEYGEKMKSYTLSSQSYLRQVLDEALRMSQTVNFSGHYSNQDTEVAGHLVPAKTPIIHAIGVAMMNNAVWKNPNTFDPDRFAPGSVHAKRGPEFRPFGIPNIRRCPANQFTYFMVSVFVTILLQRFVMLTNDKTEAKKDYSIASSPKEKLYIEVQLRYQE